MRGWEIELFYEILQHKVECLVVAIRIVEQIFDRILCLFDRASANLRQSLREGSLRVEELVISSCSVRKPSGWC